MACYTAGSSVVAGRISLRLAVAFVNAATSRQRNHTQIPPAYLRVPAQDENLLQNRKRGSRTRLHAVRKVHN